jgi:hypothetical protein
VIRDALTLAAVDLLTGIGIVLVLGTVAVVIAGLRRPRQPRITVTAVLVRDGIKEAFTGPHPNGWPAKKPTPVGEAHLGKTRLPDSEQRRAA